MYVFAKPGALKSHTQNWQWLMSEIVIKMVQEALNHFERKGAEFAVLAVSWVLGKCLTPVFVPTLLVSKVTSLKHCLVI